MMYVGLLLLLGVALLMGLLLFFLKQFNQVRSPFEHTASALGLTLTYSHPNDLMMTGVYNGYRATLISIRTGNHSTPSLPCFKATLPMINPQGKVFVVWKGTFSNEKPLSVDKLIPLKETFSAELTGKSNDLMFSSLLLSAQVKAAIERFFSDVHTAELFIYEDELNLIFPAEQGADGIARGFHLLAEIKDSLRP